MRALLYVPPTTAQSLDTEELQRAQAAWREALSGVCTVIGPATSTGAASALAATADAATEECDAKPDCVIALGRTDVSIQDTLSAVAHAAAPTVYMWPISKEEALNAAFMDGTLTLPKTSVHEVWMYQQSLPAARTVHHALAESTMRVVPQLWTPSPLASMLGVEKPDDAEYDAPSRNTEGGIDVVIVSDLVGTTADVLYPLLICAMVPHALRNVIVLRDAPLPPGAIEYVAQHIPELANKVKYVKAGRHEVVSFFMKRPHYSVFLYHQNGRTEFPSLLWDLCFLGVPVVHNLQTSMGAGLRYAEVSTATKLITLLPASLGAPYLARNREHLRALMPSRVLPMLQAFIASLPPRAPSAEAEAGTVATTTAAPELPASE